MLQSRIFIKTWKIFTAWKFRSAISRIVFYTTLITEKATILFNVG
jgi:hypothetical protein